MIEIGNISSTPIEKVLNINDVNDNVVIKYAIGEKDSLTKMLMQDHNVSISFNYPTFTSFKKGYYLIFKGIKYWLMNDYKAVENNGQYRYDLVFHAKEMLFQDAQMYYTNSNIEQSEYGLTGNATYFLQLAVENINKHYGANFVNQGTVEPTDIKYIQFANDTNVFDALGQVCDTFECEWLLVGDTINIVKKANFGDAVDFRVGETVLKIDRREGENTFDANRILALGSTLNLTEDYQGGDYMIGAKRLRINPSKGKYIDLKPNLTPTEIKTATVIFDDIYPKRVGNIDEVREIEYKVDEDGNEVITKQYRFKDDGIIFSDDYLLPNEPLMLVFETGKLAGLHFELYFSKDGYSETDNSQYYEILVNTNYGSQLPNDTLKPEAGDKYVLYNFNIELVSHVYIPEAENELFEYATRWLKDEWIDKGVYECPIMGRYSRDNDVDLEIGQRVDLYSPIFDSGKRESRVMGYVKPLMSKYDATYTIGDNKAYSSKSSINQRITKIEATEYAINGVSGSDGYVYIIKQFDNSLPTDFNVYSAKATDAKYFNKQKGGSVLGDTLFTKNVQTQGVNVSDVFQNSTFTAGAFGTGMQFKNDANGYSYGELDYLRVRKEMLVSQLTIDEIKSVGGTILLSLANIVSSNVVDNGTSYRVYFDNQDGKLLNKFVVGDQAIRQTFNGTNIVRYWRLVTGVGADYIDLSKTDAEQGSSIPLVGDEIIQLGNRSNVMRQHAILLSAYGSDAPSIKQYSAINSFSLLNKEATVISPSGNKFKGVFEITSNGTTTVVYKDRGLFVNGTQYYKNERVSWLGSLWVCLEDTKTIPSETATYWRKETSGQTDINSSIDNIKIGGVNIFSKNMASSDGWVIELNTNNLGRYGTAKSIVIPISGLSYISISFKSIPKESDRFAISTYTSLSTGQKPVQVIYHRNDGTIPSWNEKEGVKISDRDKYLVIYYGTSNTPVISYPVNLMVEGGNKVTSYSPSPHDVQIQIDVAKENAEDANNYINNVLKDQIEAIQDQLDGKVNSYFYDYDPTLNNIPAVEWTTEQLKSEHLNDTFTNTDSGKSWRWGKVNNVYKWIEITDTASLEALQKAQEALNIANDKMQVFVTEPYTPYKIGDLWVQGANGDIMKCKTTRLTGNFNPSDWDRASKYTDDSKANQVGDNLEQFSTQTTTKFQALGDKIESKVDSQTFNQLDQLVQTHSSQITQLDSSITSTVEKVDNIRFGGVNLLLDTSTPISVFGNGGTQQIGGVYYISNDTLSNNGIGVSSIDDIVVSFKLEIIGDKQGEFRLQGGSPSYPNLLPSFLILSELNNINRFSFVSQINSSNNNFNRIQIRLDNVPTTTRIIVSEMILEHGNKSSMWSPSPQDIQGEINSKNKISHQNAAPEHPNVGDFWIMKSLVDSNGVINADQSKNIYQLQMRWDGTTWQRVNWSATKSKVEQTDSQIRQTVEKTGIDQLGQGENLYSVFDQRADSITIEVSNVSSKADAAQNTANDANNAASDAQDKANKAEQDALNARDAANNAQSTANTANSNVNSLETYVDGAFKDGVITEAEAMSIASLINTVNESFSSLDGTYSILYSNQYLTGTAKSNLKSKYDMVAVAKNSLITSINNAIADGKTTEEERDDVNSKYSVYNVRIKDYYSSVEAANKSIQDKLDELSTNKVDNIQIGGVNLLNDSSFEKSIGGSAIVNQSVISRISGGYNGAYCMKTVSADSSSSGYSWGSLPTVVGKEYTVSCFVKADTEISGCTFGAYTGSWQSVKVKSIDISTEWTRVDIAFVATGANMKMCILKADVTFYVDCLQLEEGNKATSWSPSPEDVQHEITKAQEDASKSLKDLSDIANDNKFTPDEKQRVSGEMGIIRSEKPIVDAQADKVGANKSAYNTAYTNLNNYITPLLSNINTTSDIVGNTFRDYFKKYYDAKIELLKNISDSLKNGVDNAQSAANQAKSDAANAKTAAINAQSSANTANSLLTDLASDNKFTPNEKNDVKREWETIKSEYSKNITQADKFEISKTAYTSAYVALRDYITPLLSNMTSTSNINNTTFTNTFKNYYDAQVDLLNNVSTKAKQIADNAQSKADEADSKATQAQQKLTDMAKDAVLSAVEKKEVKVEIDKIDKEYAKLTVQGQIFNQSIVAYKAAYDALKAYINPLLAEIGASDIVPATYVSMFTNYNTEKVNLQNAIAIKNKDIADSKTTADEVKAGMTMTSDGFLFYGKVFRVDSTIIANAIETGGLVVTGGNFQVTKEGVMSAKGANVQGKIESNSLGNKITIDPSSRSLTMTTDVESVSYKVAELSFVGDGRDAYSVLNMSTIGQAGINRIEIDGYGIKAEGESGEIIFSTGSSKTIVKISNLPTSKAGLSSGYIWRDGEFLKIVP